MLNLNSVVAELERERERINAALNALVGDATSKPQEPRPAAATPTPTATATAPQTPTRNHKPRRSMSPESRKKISKAMKSRWAKQQPKRRKLSKEARDRISASQRKRWATLKGISNATAPETQPNTNTNAA